MTEGFGGNATDRIHDLLREEAEIEPDQPHTGPVKRNPDHRDLRQGRHRQELHAANLSYMMAQQGKKVLLIGCDPKSDTTSLLFGGKACPTIIETSPRRRPPARRSPSAMSASSATASSPWSSAARKSAAAAAGAASSTASRLLEKLGFHDWDFDYVLLDFLGDVVCGGFGLPIARDMCQKVIVVGSNDLQSLYVANNVCSAVEYFRKLGGNVGVAGMVINKDDGTGEAQAFAERSAFRCWPRSRQDDDIRRKSANYEIIGKPDGRWGAAVRGAGQQRRRGAAGAPEAADQDGCSNLFDGEDTGRDFVLEPATSRGHVRRRTPEKPSLEVVYDDV
jgi:chlorophyllide a reductase subunit X